MEQVFSRLVCLYKKQSLLAFLQHFAKLLPQHQKNGFDANTCCALFRESMFGSKLKPKFFIALLQQEARVATVDNVKNAMQELDQFKTKVRNVLKEQLSSKVEMLKQIEEIRARMQSLDATTYKTNSTNSSPARLQMLPTIVLAMCLVVVLYVLVRNYSAVNTWVPSYSMSASTSSSNTLDECGECCSALVLATLALRSSSSSN